MCRPHTRRVPIVRLIAAFLLAGYTGCSDISTAVPTGPGGGPDTTEAPQRVASMTVVSGDNQLARAGTPLRNPLKVLLEDVSGNAVGGATVTFTILSGEGSISDQEVAADARGIATSPAWTLGPMAGSQQVAARWNKQEVVFTAQACPLDVCPPALFFVRQRQIFSADVTTGAETQLTFAGNNDWPAISRDGQRIAFVRYDGWWVADVYVMNADGSNVTRRTTGSNFSFPAWSPDGKTLAVATSEMPYWGEIYLLSAVEDGTPPVKIADDASMPAWSPDGKRIAYVSLSGDDGYHALHVVNADGSELTEVVARDQHALDSPDWSSDGRRISFSSCLHGRCDVRVIEADGSPVWDTSIGNAVWPSWSRDGRWIAFTMWTHDVDARTSSSRIAFVSADDGSRAIPAVADGHSPAW